MYNCTVGKFEHQSSPSLKLPVCQWGSCFEPGRPIIYLHVAHIYPYLPQGDHGSLLMKTNVIKQWLIHSRGCVRTAGLVSVQCVLFLRSSVAKMAIKYLT